MIGVNTIVVFGANGMLGRACCKYFDEAHYNVIGYTRAQFDATKDGFDSILRLSKMWPLLQTVVINAIGLIPQRNNNDKADYIKANSVFPHVLSAFCRAKSIPMFHITTDCVYDGLNGPYSEGTPATEAGIYGVSKACGEPPEAMIIRTSIIGEEGQTASGGTYSLLEWVRSQNGGTIKGFTNHMWSGVTTQQLAAFIYWCITSNIMWQGVRHVVSPVSVSKYELVCMIKKAYQLDLEIEPFETPVPANKVLLPSRDPVIVNACHAVVVPLMDQIEASVGWLN